MTLTQLRSFVTVARLGSVKGAAQSLGVTEAAVSGAVAALRRELGDVLFIRAAGGISLTPGGSRLAAGAAEIVGLAEETRHRVRQTGSGTAHLRVASTEAGAEQVLPALLAAFGRRQPDLDVETLAVPVAVFGDLLRDRRADVTIGPAPRPAGPVESIPFLRFQLAVVAAPDHPLRHRRRLAPAQLAGEPWLLGPAGLDPGTLSGAFLSHIGVEATGAKAFPSVTASLNAVAAGAGLSVAFLHVVRDDLRRGSLVRLDVAGARLTGMLCASAGDRSAGCGAGAGAARRPAEGRSGGPEDPGRSGHTGRATPGPDERRPRRRPQARPAGGTGPGRARRRPRPLAGALTPPVHRGSAEPARPAPGTGRPVDFVLARPADRMGP